MHCFNLNCPTPTEKKTSFRKKEQPKQNKRKQQKPLWFKKRQKKQRTSKEFWAKESWDYDHITPSTNIYNHWISCPWQKKNQSQYSANKTEIFQPCNFKNRPKKSKNMPRILRSRKRQHSKKRCMGRNKEATKFIANVNHQLQKDNNQTSTSTNPKINANKERQRKKDRNADKIKRLFC